MKKAVIFFTLISITYIGCNSNDDSSNGNLQINQQNLLGKWYLKGGTVNGGSFENYQHDCSSLKDYQEFFSNHELKFNDYNSDCELNNFNTSNWVLSGNALTVSNPQFDPMIYEYNYIILSLTSEQLILKQTATTPNGVEDFESYFTRN